MNEHILTFGSGNRLVGTLTQPADKARDTAILLVNAGVIHRMGPHRINVKLARHLASQGFLVLRLDLSGQGDSQGAEGGLTYEQQAVADLKAAMDHIQRLTSARKFALAGICSGAHHGVSTAIEDDRLQALWLMDTHAYPTAKTTWVRARRQLEQDCAGTLMRWTRKVLTSLASRLTLRKTNSPDPARLIDNPYPSPPKDVFAQRIQQLIDRQVRLQAVYSAGMLWQYNYTTQWQDSFREHGAVAHVPCDLLPDVDHTLSSLHAQHRMMESVSKFVTTLA